MCRLIPDISHFAAAHKSTLNTAFFFQLRLRLIGKTVIEYFLKSRFDLSSEFFRRSIVFGNITFVFLYLFSQPGEFIRTIGYALISLFQIKKGVDRIGIAQYTVLYLYFSDT